MNDLGRRLSDKISDRLLADVAGRRLGKARLIGLRSADGYWSVKFDNAAVGKTYTVDLNSRRSERFVNLPASKVFECEVIDVWDEGRRLFIHYPIELLDIQPDGQSLGERQFELGRKFEILLGPKGDFAAWEKDVRAYAAECAAVGVTIDIEEIIEEKRKL